MVGKIIRLRQKLVDAADSVKGLFGMKKEQDSAVAQLEKVQVSSFFPAGLLRQSRLVYGHCLTALCVPVYQPVSTSDWICRRIAVECCVRWLGALAMALAGCRQHSWVCSLT